MAIAAWSAKLCRRASSSTVNGGKPVAMHSEDADGLVG